MLRKHIWDRWRARRRHRAGYPDPLTQAITKLTLRLEIAGGLHFALRELLDTCGDKYVLRYRSPEETNEVKCDIRF
jgi:hypothetical protein